MKNSFDEKILEEAKDWLVAKQNIVLATVIQTWGHHLGLLGAE